MKFRKTFTTPYDQMAAHEGKLFKIIRKLTDDERDPEIGTMYCIQLDDGEKIDAWPEEVEGIAG